MYKNVHRCTHPYILCDITHTTLIYPRWYLWLRPGDGAQVTPMTTTKTPVFVRLPTTLHKQFQRALKLDGTSQQAFFEEAAREYVEEVSRAAGLACSCGRVFANKGACATHRRSCTVVA